MPQWRTKKALLWEYACTVENEAINDHPIARAIFGSGLQQLGSVWAENQSLRTSQNIIYEPGKGVQAEVQLAREPRRHVIIGSRSYLLSSGVAGMPDRTTADTEGMIVVYLGIDKTYSASFSISVRLDSISDTWAHIFFRIRSNPKHLA